MGETDRDWLSLKKMMANPRHLEERTRGFDLDNVSEGTLRKVKPFVSQDSFNPDVVKKNSAAAAGICDWVLAVYNYALTAPRVR